MQTQPVSNIQFKGIPLSKVKIMTDKGEAAKYTLYKAIHGDEPFLEDIYLHTNVMNRYKKLTQDEYKTWDCILMYGLNQMLGNNKFTLLIADNKKCPCGFLNYTEYPQKLVVNYAATWPNKENERGIMAGKTLFRELFDIFVNDRTRKTIELEALRLAPFSPVTKYRELGFYSVGGSNWQESMKISNLRALETIEKFKDKILRREIKKEINVDFNETLHIVTD